MRKNYIITLLFWGLVLSDFAQSATWFPIASGTSTDLVAVASPSSSVCYVAGASGLIRKSVNGGASWTTQTSNTTNTLYYFAFTDINTGFVVGNGGTVLKTINGGSTWTPVSLGTTGAMRCVYFYDMNTGYITGGTGSSGTPGFIYKTVDGGSTWNQLNTSAASTNSIYGIFFTSPSIGYANDYDKNVLKTMDGGNSWTSINIGGNGALLGTMHFTSAVKGTITGMNGSIMRTTDSGASWNAALGGPVTTDQYNGQGFYDSSNGFIVGGNVMNNTGVILSTTDGGANWSAYYPGSSRLYGIDMVNANLGYAVGLNGTILMYSSSVGIEEIAGTGGLIFNNYPNPFATFTTIDLNPHFFVKDAVIKIFDVNGNLVRNILCQQKTKVIINKSSLSQGTYFFYVLDGETFVGSGKLITN
jgi:photosystem II stability/assembly factor-like uncharacterized protein